MKTLFVSIGGIIILGLAAIYLYASPQPRTSSTTQTTPSSSAPSLSVHSASPRVVPQPILASPPLATPVVATPTATPSMIVVNTPTTVTVTVAITPAPISNGVNLLRIGATGTQPTILGVMHDDAKNGDAAAGDGVYTLSVPFDETAAGQIQLQASVAFQGMLKRVLSSSAVISVWSAVTDAASGLTFNLPPLNTPPLINNLGPSSGSQFSIDVGALDSSDNQPHSLFRIFALSNPTQQALEPWFESNVDDGGGSLLTSGAFEEQQLPNGLALVLVGPIPAAYQGGPVAQAYMELSASRGQIYAIIQSQDGTLTDFGYSASSIPTLLISILESLR